MRTQASYRIFGDDAVLTAERVTQALGVEPTSSVEVGGRGSPGSVVARVAGWWLASGDGPENDVELAAQLQRLLTTLLPKREALWELVADGYKIDWFCYLGSHAAEHAAELSRELLADLINVPGDLLIDVYEEVAGEAE